MMAAKRKEMALANNKQPSPTKNFPSSSLHSALESSASPTIPTSLPNKEDKNTETINEEKLFEGGFFRITSPASNRQGTPAFPCKSKSESSSTLNTPGEKYVPIPPTHSYLMLMYLILTHKR